MKKISILLIAILVLSCSKEEKPTVLRTQNLITSFSLEIEGDTYEGQIDQQERVISINTEGLVVSSLKPSINISAGARIEPSPDLMRDFSQEVSYTVYAEDGTPNVYRVQVNNRPISSENEIESFSFEVDGTVTEGRIDRENGIITAEVPFSDISALTPLITISDYATIAPSDEEEQDFTIPVTYTVTAENGDVRTYTVRLNEPKIESITLAYSSEPKFFVGAEAGVMGKYLMNEGENSEIYLFDGTDRYELDQVEFHFSYQDSGTGVFYYAASFVIPDDIPTNIYTIILEKRGYRVEFEGMDIKAENAPEPQSLNKEEFTWDDVIKIKGENLTPRISIPSNGSLYLLWETYAVDINLNEERTELTFKPNYRQHNLFPSYYGREAGEKKITFFDETGRVGRSIKTIFK